MNKEHFVLPGYIVGISSLGLITYRTLLAISTNSKAITVTVNQYGEQYLDVVLLAVLWIVCIIGILALTLQRNTQKSKTSEENDHYRPQQAPEPLPLHISCPPFNSNASEDLPFVPYSPITLTMEPVSPREIEPGPVVLSEEKKGKRRRPLVRPYPRSQRPGSHQPGSR